MTGREVFAKYGLKSMVDVLGVEYDILYRLPGEDEYLKQEDIGGYCDFYSKIIVINVQEETAVIDFTAYLKKNLRHEIVHAFFYESGLAFNSGRITNQGWAVNEELIDWIAIQGEKVHNAWKETGCDV